MSALVRLPALFGASRRAWIRVGLATLALGMTGAFNATVSLAADEKADSTNSGKSDEITEIVVTAPVSEGCDSRCTAVISWTTNVAARPPRNS